MPIKRQLNITNALRFNAQKFAKQHGSFHRGTPRSSARKFYKALFLRRNVQTNAQKLMSKVFGSELKRTSDKNEK